MGREIEASGDVAKIVVKPHSEENVLTFLNGTLAAPIPYPIYRADQLRYGPGHAPYRRTVRH